MCQRGSLFGDSYAEKWVVGGVGNYCIANRIAGQSLAISGIGHLPSKAGTHVWVCVVCTICAIEFRTCWAFSKRKVSVERMVEFGASSSFGAT